MKQTKRIASICMMATMLTVTAFSTGCQVGEEIVADEKTINISMMNATISSPT